MSITDSSKYADNASGYHRNFFACTRWTVANELSEHLIRTLFEQISTSNILNRCLNMQLAYSQSLFYIDRTDACHERRVIFFLVWLTSSFDANPNKGEKKNGRPRKCETNKKEWEKKIERFQYNKNLIRFTAVHISFATCGPYVIHFLCP